MTGEVLMQEQFIGSMEASSLDIQGERSFDEFEQAEPSCENQLGAIAVCASCPLLRMWGECPKGIVERASTTTESVFSEDVNTQFDAAEDFPFAFVTEPTVFDSATSPERDTSDSTDSSLLEKEKETIYQPASIIWPEETRVSAIAVKKNDELVSKKSFAPYPQKPAISEVLSSSPTAHLPEKPVVDKPPERTYRDLLFDDDVPFVTTFMPNVSIVESADEPELLYDEKAPVIEVSVPPNDREPVLLTKEKPNEVSLVAITTEEEALVIDKPTATRNEPEAVTVAPSPTPVSVPSPRIVSQLEGPVGAKVSRLDAIEEELLRVDVVEEVEQLDEPGSVLVQIETMNEVSRDSVVTSDELASPIAEEVAVSTHIPAEEVPAELDAGLIDDEINLARSIDSMNETVPHLKAESCDHTDQPASGQLTQVVASASSTPERLAPFPASYPNAHHRYQAVWRGVLALLSLVKVDASQCMVVRKEPSANE